MTSNIQTSCAPTIHINFNIDFKRRLVYHPMRLDGNTILPQFLKHLACSWALNTPTTAPTQLPIALLDSMS